ncbi:MAG TPA: hypothetical protein VGM14_21530 [Streptosporangiaceae bacterium]
MRLGLFQALRAGTLCSRLSTQDSVVQSYSRTFLLQPLIAARTVIAAA